MSVNRFVTLRTLVLLGLLSLSMGAMAAQSDLAKVPTKTADSQQLAGPVPNAACPTVAELKLKGQRWYGPAGWKASEDSFVNEIDYFMGAQWIGVKLGQVICNYQGKQKYAFSINLERRDVLIPEPTGGNWGGNVGGYRNCVSKNTNNCKFYVEPPKKEINVQDIYQQLKSIKK